jgi:leucyl-tRNA synthetase
LVKALTGHYERLEFNNSVARIREIANIIFTHKVSESNFEAAFASFRMLLVVSAPIFPHLADELWHMLAGKEILLNYPWPQIDDSLCQQDEVTIAVQVNGKLRDTLLISKDLPRDKLEELVLAMPKVKATVGDSIIKKVIIVPGKICNVVI